MDFSVMAPAAGVVGVGLVLAFAMASRVRTTDASIAAEAERIDLQSTRDEVMAALKQLELDKDKLDATDYQAERKALLERGANALRALETGTAARPTSAPATPHRAAARPARSLSHLPDLPMPEGTEPVIEGLRDLLDEHGAKRFRAAMVALARERPKAVVPQLLADEPPETPADDASAEPPAAPAAAAPSAPAAPAPAPPSAPAPADAPALSPTYKGALIMLGLVVIVGTFVYFAQQGSVTRRDGAGMTGNQELGSPTPPPAPGGPMQLPPEIQAMQSRLDANPEDIEAINGLTEFYLSVGDAAKSMQLNDKAKEIAPDDPDTRTFQAVLRAMVGMFPPAIEQLEAVVKDHPDHASAWSYLGLIQYDKGDKARGVEALEKAVELQPENFGLKQALERARRGEPLSGGGPPPPPPAGANPAGGGGEIIVSGRASLAPGETVNGTETVFVSIRDPARPGPPVAAKKFVASQLPLDFTITTADRIMMGGGDTPLPDTVSVSVRVDADNDGNAMTKTPMDPTATEASVALGTTGLELSLAKP